MRKYLFTDTERRVLKEWIKTGKETKQTQKLFSKIRRINPRIVNDLKLFFQIRKKLIEQQRWRLNVPRSAYGPLLDESASTPRLRD